MQDLVTGYTCGGSGEPCDPQSRPYYRPVANVTRQQMAKFIDNARRLPEIHITVPSGSAPVYSRNDTGTAISAYSTSGQALTAQSSTQLAIYAQTGNSTAIYGFSTGGPSSIGVRGDGEIGVLGEGTTVHLDDGAVKGVNTDGVAVRGISTNSIGVYGTSGTGGGVSGYSVSNYGIYGAANISQGGQAGHFSGNVLVTDNMTVTGNLSKGAGSFKIDDPLDPANKYLYHSFVESPDMMNVYNGNITLDSFGEATVQLPDWFDALNKEYRYQLTAVGAPGPNLYISKKVENNHFSISGGTPGMEVSWQVTGIRQDPYANAHRIPVEQDKPANEKGKYLHPTEWGQPASSGIGYEEQQKMQEATQSMP